MDVQSNSYIKLSPKNALLYCIVLMTINELSQTIVNAIGLCLGFSNMMGG